MKRDAEIQQDVLDELNWDSRIEVTDVGVEVDDGVVTLTGTVDSYARRMAAVEAAHRVAGVRDVADNIQVRVPGILGRTDTDLAQAVRHALEWDALVPDERIRSTVSHGIVTLVGTVERFRHLTEAERAVRSLAGVIDVVNEIEVVPGVQPKPATIHQAIERVLERRADREASHVHVAVQDGTVTLSGSVRSVADKRAVVGAVGHAPGVRAIREYLRVDPFS